MKPVTIDLE